MDQQKYLILDYESRSEADLKKVGAWEYSVHPSTEILCAAWKYGTREELKTAKTYVWSPLPNAPYTGAVGIELAGILGSFGVAPVMAVAHNALFEQVITRNVLLNCSAAIIPHEQWICTASLAAALALPRALEGACAALGLKTQKDMDGRKLLLKMCKPRKATKNNQAKWHETPEQIARLMEYCKTDVDAETELFLRLPPLNPLERKIWCLDQKINFRGFKVDRELVDTTLGLIDERVSDLDYETFELTSGAVRSTTQRDATLRWIRACGEDIGDLTAATIQAELKHGGNPPEVHRILEIRAAVSKSSTAKYKAFQLRSESDGTIRDNLVYHSASTGRWGGSGVQPQNLPKSSIKDTDQAAEIVKTGDLDLIRMVYGEPMNTFSSCIRAAIIPREGKEFFCADYAGIEARVLFWVSRHEAGLDIFREGRDIYREMASHIYGVPVDEVDKNQRWLGKTTILGSGFGMGAKKFRDTCTNQGLEIDEDTAKLAIGTYRTTHKLVVQCWSNIEKAAIAAVKNPGKKYTINRTSWWVADNFLWCELPSKRRLAYYGPTLRMAVTPWKEKRVALYHWGVNSVTRKWENASTYSGVLVENVVQAISRDLMAEAMLRIEDAGYDIVLSVHDELLAERDRHRGELKEFENLMAKLPDWAEGLPVKVEGYRADRYRK